MDEQTKPQKHRSPSYPAVDLETALARARVLRNIAGSHAAPLQAVVEAWGFSPRSSNGLVTVAALKKYGLADDSGSGQARQVKLTRLGLEAVFFGEETSEWLDLIQTAALNPSIYAALWNKYGPELPHDRVMLHELVFEREFSEPAAKDVLRQFRKTVRFAKLADSAGTISGDETENRQEQEKEPLLTTPPTIEASSHTRELQDVAITHSDSIAARVTRTVQITYSPTEWALLQGKFPMTEDEWDAMIAVLTAMKRGLVEESGEP